MPLRALADGRDIVAPLLSDSDWVDLTTHSRAQRDALVLPCCAAPAYPRVSRAGLRHFVHRPGAGTCGGGRETAEHLTAKAEVARALAVQGFEVRTEVAGPDWRADVLGERGALCLAVELQLSPQSLVDTQIRHERYRRDGIKALWFFGRPPHHTPSRGLPLFALSVDARACRVTVRLRDGLLSADRCELGIDVFLRTLLSRGIRFCSRLRTTKRQEIGVVIREVTCDRCRESSQVYAFRGQMWSPCGAELDVTAWKPFDSVGGFEPDPSWFTGPMARREWQGLFPYVEFRRPRRMGEYRSTGHGIIVRAFACPYCGESFGAQFLRHAFFRGPVIRQETRIVHLAAPLFEQRPHWCYAPGGSFCE